ncbi:hypothetical protein F5884DRAFT_380849 [Xylogone sp. PMI_703]|nr:hypothetical protein F5884DRAFT_380849 [Xylogone sp. PMI_703]
MSLNPYAAAHKARAGPGDSRPTAERVVKDLGDLSHLRKAVIVITGATSGIGFEAAKTLYSTGAHLYLTVRDGRKAEEYVKKIEENSAIGSSGKIELIHMELDSLESVRAGAAEILTKTDRIDILINNAGISAVPFGHTRDGYEMQWGINYLSHFLLSYLLLPRLMESRANGSVCSRMVNVSSTGHRIFPTHMEDPNFEKTPYEPFSAYATSKLANIYHANQIERMYGSRGVHALSVHPGTIKETGLLRHTEQSILQTMEQGAQVIPGYREELKNSKQGAATIVWAAIAPVLEGKGGIYLENCTIAQPVQEGATPIDGGYGPFAFDPAAETSLWKDTCKLLNLPEDLK